MDPLKENARLRKEIATYQSALEAMEFRAKRAELFARSVQKRLEKIVDAVMAGEKEKEEK